MTPKTAHITLSILHVERYTRPYQRSHAANWCDMKLSQVCEHALCVSRL